MFYWLYNMLFIYSFTSLPHKNYRTTNSLIDNYSHLKLYPTNQPDFNPTNIQTIHYPLIQSHTGLSHTKPRETK